MILWCRCKYPLLKPGKIWDLEITVDAMVPCFILASRLKHCPPTCWEGLWVESLSRLCHWPKELLLSRPGSFPGSACIQGLEWARKTNALASRQDNTDMTFQPWKSSGICWGLCCKDMSQHDFSFFPILLPSSPPPRPSPNVVLKSTPRKSTASGSISKGIRSIQGDERNTSSQGHSLRKS